MNQGLKNVLEYFEQRDGYDLNEVIEDMVAELNMLKHPSMGEHSLSMGECGIEWDDDCICVLDDFVRAYTHKLLEGVCNVIKSELKSEEEDLVDEEINVGDSVVVLGAIEEDVDGILGKYQGSIVEVMSYNPETKSVVVELNGGTITIDLYKGEYKRVESK